MALNSIRDRLLLWLGFLLACLLVGFGFTANQLHQTNQFNQVDRELERRVGALSVSVRGSGPPPPGGRRPGPGGAPLFRPGFPEERGPERFSSRPGFETNHEGVPRPPFDARRRPPSEFGRGGRDFGPPGPRSFGGPREIRLTPAAASLFDESDTNSFYFAIWSVNGNLLKGSANAPALVPPLQPGRDTTTQNRTRNAFREAFHFTEMGDCILVGRPILADLTAARRFTWLLVAVGTTVLAIGLGGGWLLVTRAIEPVNEISAAASRIADGNLAERISVSDTASELGRLAGVLNATFSRLESAFAQQKQFTADASHELRTPLAVIIAEAQTTLARPRDAVQYRESIAVCLEAAQQMRRLADSLLDLARFDSGQRDMSSVPLDLAAVASAAVDLIRPLAASRNVTVTADLQNALVQGDAERLAQVFTNLLANGVHYNQANGQLRVSTRVTSTGAEAVIEDTGQGIGPEDLPHVFERFFRADKSRSRTEGRAGLGLAIAKAIVEAHGGTITVASEPNVGTRFVLWFPSPAES
jgi:two-component system OmpR family sensor kinase